MWREGRRDGLPASTVEDCEIRRVRVPARYRREGRQLPGQVRLAFPRKLSKTVSGGLDRTTFVEQITYCCHP